MKTGSSDLRPFKPFQIRWAEKLGLQEYPYLIRWTFLFFNYSIRIHHWLKSDDDRYFHDHASDLVSIVLKGYYWNVKPIDPNKNPYDTVPKYSFDYMIGSTPATIESDVNNIPIFVEGIFDSWYNFFHPWKSIWFSKAEDRHFLRIPKDGAWTLMLEGRPRHTWGFYINGKRVRPLAYFHKYGIIQTKNYQ